MSVVQRKVGVWLANLLCALHSHFLISELPEQNPVSATDVEKFMKTVCMRGGTTPRVLHNIIISEIRLRMLKLNLGKDRQSQMLSVARSMW